MKHERRFFQIIHTEPFLEKSVNLFQNRSRLIGKTKRLVKEDQRLQENLRHGREDEVFPPIRPAEPDTAVADLVHEVPVTLTPDIDQEEVGRLLSEFFADA